MRSFIIRILLFRGTILGSPIFGNPQIERRERLRPRVSMGVLGPSKVPRASRKGSRRESSTDFWLACSSSRAFRSFHEEGQGYLGGLCPLLWKSKGVSPQPLRSRKELGRPEALSMSAHEHGEGEEPSWKNARTLWRLGGLGFRVLAVRGPLAAQMRLARAWIATCFPAAEKRVTEHIARLHAEEGVCSVAR